MSFWQLIKMFVRVLMGHRRYQRGMDQLRTSSLRLKAIDETLAAYRKGDFEEGLRIAETMKGNPMLQGPYLFFSGTMLMHLGRFQEAEQRLRRNLTAQTGAQSTALAYSSLGQLLLELQRYDEAVECFETSLRHWPERGSGHRDLAEACLRRGGQASDAVQWARLAVLEDRSRISPADSPKLREVCDINLGEDLATMAWAVAEDSRDRPQVDSLVDEAVPLVRGAVSPSAMVHYLSGHAYLALGDSVKSGQHFYEAGRIDPNGLWGRSARGMNQGMRA